MGGTYPPRRQPTCTVASNDGLDRHVDRLHWREHEARHPPGRRLFSLLLWALGFAHGDRWKAGLFSGLFLIIVIRIDCIGLTQAHKQWLSGGILSTHMSYAAQATAHIGCCRLLCVHGRRQRLVIIRVRLEFPEARKLPRLRRCSAWRGHYGQEDSGVDH